MTTELPAASAHHDLNALCREHSMEAVRALTKIAGGEEPEAARLAATELHRRGLGNLIDPNAESCLPNGYVFALTHGRWPTEADFIEGAAEARLTHEQRVDRIGRVPNILMGEIGK